MRAKFVHRCTHVLDKEKTIAFYEKALGFHVVREMGPEDGSWTNSVHGERRVAVPAGAHVEPRAH